MTKQIKIQIYPDGRVQADIAGIKGMKCTDYIRILEEILDAEAVDSSYTPEYFQTEEVELEEIEQQRLHGQQEM
jgi:hypothetical protein